MSRAGPAQEESARLKLGTRALGRGERVLLVCYNDPLGAEFQQKFVDSDGVVLTGFFFDWRNNSRECRRIQGEGESNQDFWDKTVQGHHTALA